MWILCPMSPEKQKNIKGNPSVRHLVLFVHLRSSIKQHQLKPVCTLLPPVALTERVLFFCRMQKHRHTHTHTHTSSGTHTLTALHSLQMDATTLSGVRPVPASEQLAWHSPLHLCVHVSVCEFLYLLHSTRKLRTFLGSPHFPKVAKCLWVKT